MFAFLFLLGLGRFTGKELSGDSAAILMLVCVAVAAAALGVDFGPAFELLQEAGRDVVYVVEKWIEKF